VNSAGGVGRHRERVLLIGNYGNGNTGDDAILTRVAPQVQEYGDVTVLSRAPGRVSMLVPGINSVDMVSIRAVTGFLRSDAVVIGGGGMFGRGLPVLVACLPFVLLVALAMGKNVELRAVGAYPDMPGPVAWALRRVVRRARLVSARDNASVRALGGSEYVELVRDPAWELDPAPKDVVDSVLHSAGVRTSDRPLVAVSLKPGAGAEADRLCRLAVAGGLNRWAQGRECDVLFMCFSDKGDYQLGADLTDSDLGRQLQDQMASGPCVRFIGPDLHPSVMLGVIKRCSAVVAMRLHAQIFASSVDRPVYGLSFELKCDEFLDSVGISPIRPDEISADDFGNWLMEVAPYDEET
jgi:polysaccharide pyruvyl transferase WcaK-like protein